MRNAIIDGKMMEKPGLPFFNESGKVTWLEVNDPQNWVGVWLNGKFLGYRKADPLPVNFRLPLTNMVGNVLCKLFRHLSGEDFESQKTHL